MATKYHIGFVNTIVEGKANFTGHILHTAGVGASYNVYDICKSSTGEIVAFATSKENANLIIGKLNA